MHLFRIIRFFRLFRSLFTQHGIIRRSVVKGEGQPTRCGHTLRGVHYRGWRVAAPLRTLQRQKS